MPRGKQSKSAGTFTKDEAKLLLEQLIVAGLVKSRDLAEARRALDFEVVAIQARLSELKAASADQSPASPRKPAGAAPKAVVVSESSSGLRQQKRPLVTTPARKKTMQLQGRFLGFMHKIPEAEMVKFKAMIAEKGKAAAVDEMEKYVKAHAAEGAGKASSRRRRRKSRSLNHGDNQGLP